MTLVQQRQALWEKLRYRYHLLVHYEESPFGPEYQEAWNHRHELFWRFDQGIQTDAVGLYSVTPEKTAQEIAARVGGKTVVDAFCGIGGNAIAFARVCPRVIAVDLEENRLQMAEHNAQVYKQDNITFVAGDFLKIAPTVQADAVFLDPPWGGPSFADKDIFYLADFSPDGAALLDMAFRHFPHVILRVPHNFNLGDLQPYGQFVLQPNLLHGRLISQTVYFSHA